MVKAGIIGCGGISRAHAKAYLHMKDSVEIVAVADVREECAREVADMLGVTHVYKSGEALIAGETLDFVDICLPTYLHAHHAVLAMKKGMHVFLEKPVCLSEAEAALLLEIEKQTGVLVQIGQCLRFSDPYLYLKKAVEENTWGRFLGGQFFRMSARPTWGWENWFATPVKSGTAALDFHIHDADVARFIFGEPIDVKASAIRGAEGAIDHIFATYRYKDCTVTAEGGWGFPASYPFSEGFWMTFERAALSLGPDGLVLYTDEGATPITFDEAGPAGGADGTNISSLGEYYNELRYFVDRLTAGIVPDRATLAEGIASVLLVLREMKLAGGAVI